MISRMDTVPVCCRDSRQTQPPPLRNNSNNLVALIECLWLWRWATLRLWTVRISWESPCGGGGGSALVWYGGECVLVGRLKGCYWWKTVWRTRELHCYIQTENIKQLRVACSECTCTVYCGCYDNVLHWMTLNSSEHMKDFCLLFVQWLWNKCFQDG
jgi:hypothetical protein